MRFPCITEPTLIIAVEEHTVGGVRSNAYIHHACMRGSVPRTRRYTARSTST